MRLPAIFEVVSFSRLSKYLILSSSFKLDKSIKKVILNCNCGYIRTGEQSLHCRKNLAAVDIAPLKLSSAFGSFELSVLVL